MSRFSIIAMVAVLSLAAEAQTTTDDAWLLGTWWYAGSNGVIVEGDRKDGMVFKSGNAVDLIQGSGRAYLSCSYRLHSRRDLVVSCVVRDQRRDVIFEINDSRTRLASDEDTDHGFYRRAN